MELLANLENPAKMDLMESLALVRHNPVNAKCVPLVILALLVLLDRLDLMDLLDQLATLLLEVLLAQLDLLAHLEIMVVTVQMASPALLDLLALMDRKDLVNLDRKDHLESLAHPEEKALTVTLALLVVLVLLDRLDQRVKRVVTVIQDLLEILVNLVMLVMMLNTAHAHLEPASSKPLKDDDSAISVAIHKNTNLPSMNYGQIVN